MIPIGWFGVGLRRPRRRRERRRGRANGGDARLRLGLGRRAPGAHRSARAAVAAAVALGADGPRTRARLRGRGDVAHHARHRHRDPAVAQPRHPGQGAGDDRRALAGPPRGRHRRGVRAGRVRRDRRALRDPRPPRQRVDRRPPHAVARRAARAARRVRLLRRDPVPAAAPSPRRPADHRERHARPRPAGAAVERCQGWYGFYQDLDNTKAAIDELARLADEVDRPAELGKLEIIVSPVPGPIDADTVRRYEDLGVDRLVVVQDFGDMAGGPDAARRGKFLDEMAAVRRTSRHPLRTATGEHDAEQRRAGRRRSTTRSPGKRRRVRRRARAGRGRSGTTTTATTSTRARTWPRSTC